MKLAFQRGGKWGQHGKSHYTDLARKLTGSTARVDTLIEELGDITAWDAGNEGIPKVSDSDEWSPPTNWAVEEDTEELDLKAAEGDGMF